MSNHSDERAQEVLTHLAGEFISRESNRNSLITITGHKNSPDLAYMTFYFTVLPEDQEKAALDFLKRNRGEFKNFVKEKSRLQHIPFFDFEIDSGEKARQRIEKISQDLK
jgi:ribosome-binding factor A